MMYKLVNLLVILKLLFLLVNKAVYGQNFIPGPRLGQAAVVVGDKLYYTGGLEVTPKSNFFYISGQARTWVDLTTQGVNLPLKAGHAADIGGPNQDLIFIIGGLLEAQNTVYQFDTISNKLTTPIIQGKIPTGRAFINSVSYKGKIYLLGGRGDTTTYDGLDILDTISLSWRAGSLIGAPLPRFGYTATLVGETIYYIGGLQLEGTVQNFDQLSNIYQYNIGTDTWATKVSTGTTPGVRSAHTAILLDGKIYMYGGRYMTTDMVDAVPPIIPFALLDTTTLVWSIPSIDNPKVPNVAFHSATLINKLMLVAFGNLTDVPGGAPNDKFYVFDLGNPKITWTSLTAEELGNPKSPNSINPISSSTPTPNSNPNVPSSSNPNNSSNQPSSNQPLIVGLSVGLVILGIASVVGFSLIYRRTKRKKTEGKEPGEPGHILQIPPSGYPNQQNQQYLVNQQNQYPVTNQQNQYPVTNQQNQYPVTNQQNQQYLANQQNQQYHVNQNFAQSTPQYSPTPTSIQSQGHPSGSYSPGSERIESQYSPGSERVESHYSPGREAHGSETAIPPPPPPK